MDRKNILWITLDATRQDRLSCYGYEKNTTPFLNEFSKISLKFNNAFTPSPWTYPSIANFFTGKYPSQHGAWNEEFTFNRNNNTFAQYLKIRGYNTFMITQNDPWINSYYGLTKGFEHYYDRDDLMKEVIGFVPPYKFKINKLTKNFFEHHFGFGYLTKKTYDNVLKDIKSPWFIYLHLLNNHSPYEPYPLSFVSIIRRLVFYKNYFDKRRLTWINKTPFSDSELKVLNKLYDKTLIQVDKELRYYLSKINLDNTIVVITADHGDNLGDHGLLGHQFSLHDTLVKVPLIIYIPDKEGEEIDSLFETKDICRLIIDFLNDDFKHYYPKDYVYGEYIPMVETYQKLKNRAKNSQKTVENLPNKSQYVRTKNLKLVYHDNKKSELYEIKNNQEKKIENPDLRNNLEVLLKVKEKKIKDSKDKFKIVF